LNTRFLETLVWLTRLRSFSRTAELLNATQPAISNRINKLEDVLNVQLYDRTSRQFELTPAGRRILAHAEQIVTLAAELQEIALSDGQVERQIKIGVIEWVTMSWLPQLLQAITENFPKLSLEVGTGTSKDLLDKVQADEMDLAFVIGPLNEPNILSKPICKMNLAWLANPSVFDCVTEIDAVQLSRMPIILARAGASGYSHFIDYFKSYGVTGAPHRDREIVLDCVYSVGTAMHMVRTGMGIMALPPFLFTEDMEAGKVAIMPVRQKLQPFYITAISKRPASNIVIDRLTDLGPGAVQAYMADKTHQDLFL
jgi:DNA-binding transcriptional LysR family regulator